MVERVTLWKDKRGGTHNTEYGAKSYDLRVDMQEIVTQEDPRNFRKGKILCPITVADFIFHNHERIAAVIAQWKTHQAGKFNTNNLSLPGREKDD